MPRTKLETRVGLVDCVENTLTQRPKKLLIGNTVKVEGRTLEVTAFYHLEPHRNALGVELLGRIPR